MHHSLGPTNLETTTLTDRARQIPCENNNGFLWILRALLVTEEQRASRAGTGCDHLKAVVTCSLALISEPSRFEFRVDFWSPRWISGSRCGFLELWVVATSKSKLSGSCGIRWLRVRRPLPPAPSRSSNLRANGPVPTIAGGNSQTALGLLEDSSKYLEPKGR